MHSLLGPLRVGTEIHCMDKNNVGPDQLFLKEVIEF